jgi:hypothetical protein
MGCFPIGSLSICCRSSGGLSTRGILLPTSSTSRLWEKQEKRIATAGSSFFGVNHPNWIGARFRASAEITSHFAVGPQARWQGVSDEHTVAYVRSEQRSQRACGPQPKGARRRAGICCVVAPRRWHRIACVAPPCICPPGARAKMGSYFCAGP